MDEGTVYVLSPFPSSLVPHFRFTLNIQLAQDLANAFGVLAGRVANEMQMWNMVQFQTCRHLLPYEWGRTLQCRERLVNLDLIAANKDINLCIPEIGGDVDISDRHVLQPRIVEFKPDDLSYLLFQTLG